MRHRSTLLCAMLTASLVLVALGAAFADPFEGALVQEHPSSQTRVPLKMASDVFVDEFVLGLRPARVSVDLHCGGAFSGTIERFYQESWTNGAAPDSEIARAFATFNELWGQFVPDKKTAKTRDNT